MGLTAEPNCYLAANTLYVICVIILYRGNLRSSEGDVKLDDSVQLTANLRLFISIDNVLATPTKTNMDPLLLLFLAVVIAGLILSVPYIKKLVSNTPVQEQQAGI